ncbi:MAG: translation initiation factor IF-3 [Candidatus Vogelbacteria bacterium]|nr:translation initiation factor IF-3 [Candidatus Vogelbacteria bacterium]
MKERIRINHFIKAPSLRLIDETGENLGIFSLTEALAKAESAGVDLIEVSPAANPPVAKLMDFGKFQYLENKKLRQQRAKSHPTETKSIQLKIGTGDHDLEIKAGKVSEFLAAGHRVRIELYLRGRAKYFDQQFLRTRLERLLKFISVDFRRAGEPEKSAKGISVIIERAK